MQSVKQWLIKHRVNILAFLFYLILTSIAARSVLTNLNNVIVGQDPDVYINPWADWWTFKALTDPQLSLWFTNYMFYPQGANLIYHSFSHLTTLVSLALRPFLGILPAYNITMLFNIVLAGFSMFQLARYLTQSTTAGLLAGIVFAFNSHNLYQTAHPVLAAVWCFPWITLYFMRAIREDNVKYALAASIFVFLGAATSTILIILIGMWLLFLVAYMFLASEFPRPQWRILLVFGIASFVLVLPLVFPLLRDAVTNQNGNFIINPQDSIVTDIVSPFIPHWYFWLIRGVYIGVVSAFLLLLAFGHQRREARLWFWVLILSFLLAIGPVPKIFNTELGIILPWSLPFAPILRNMYRMMILFSMGLSLLVAYGWLALADQLHTTRTKTAVAAFLIGLFIFIDYTAAPFPTTPATVSAFYTDYLDAIPDDVVLASLPTGRQEDKRYMFYQTYHNHPMVNGVISRADDTIFDFIYNNALLRAGAINPQLEPSPIPTGALLDEALQELADTNVGYLILDKTLMAGEEVSTDIEEWRNTLPLSSVYEDDLVLVYEIP